MIKQIIKKIKKDTFKKDEHNQNNENNNNSPETPNDNRSWNKINNNPIGCANINYYNNNDNNQNRHLMILIN